MKLLRYKFLVIVLNFISLSALTQSIITISNPLQLVNIATNCWVFKDVGNKITYNDLPSVSSQFKAYNKPYINFGITATPYWLKIELISKIDNVIFIEIGNPALDSIQLYEEVKGGPPIIHSSGNWVPFKNREVRHVNYLFRLSMVKNTAQILYIRVKHSRGTQFPIFAGSFPAFFQNSAKINLNSGLYYGFILAMIFYNLFIYFSLKDLAYLYYVSYIFFMGLLNASLIGHAYKFLWPDYPAFNTRVDVIAVLVGLSGILFVMNFLDTKNNTPRFHILFKVLAIIYIFSLIPIVLNYSLVGTLTVEILSLVVIISFFFCAFIAMWQNYKPAKFFLIAWSFLLLSVVIFIMKDFVFIPYHPITASALQIGSAIEALLLSMALGNRINIYKEEKENAQLEAFQALNDKKRLVTEQNINLEKEVEIRTKQIKEKHDELVQALDNLKHTQAQLIQREKMASLGELTSGIAHEIQNPLNFVNNFSDVSEELLAELSDLAHQNNPADSKTAINIIDNLKQNIRMINDHGKRADSIVKSMLQHTQPNKGMMEPTDINTLMDEYLRLTYIGIKTKNISFNVNLVTNYDNHVGKIMIVPQDMARVFINLFNNAFYALIEKWKLRKPGFQPELIISSTIQAPNVELHIRDNGTGIPESIIHKIFQPFYTTKPSGKGTGLGLSLSYDIITKEHGGELTVKSQEHEFTEFIIMLPVKKFNQNKGT